MIEVYSIEQLSLIRAGGKILARCLDEVAKNIRAGVTTLELNNIAEDFLKRQGAEPSFKGYQGFPYAICASVNEESIHGMPSKKVLKDGDIISIDVGVRYGGFCTDAARTYAVGVVSDEAKKLINVTEGAFWAGVDGLRAKSKISDIGERVEDFVRANSNFSLIENFFGHGIGRNVHQEPLIPNFRVRNKRLQGIVRERLPAGCVICVEPMVNVGGKEVEVGPDKWTVVTSDKSLAAHYENTIIILEDGIEIITTT